MPEPSPRAQRRVYEGYAVSLDLEDWDAGYEVEVVHHIGAAGVLPVTREGQVLLVKQFRPAVRRSLTEIPAGLLDVDGEDALTCAARELFEETGHRHEHIEFLGGYYASPGFTDEYVHVFWALATSQAQAEQEDGIELIREPLVAMLAAARSGRVRDVKTAYALLMAGQRPDLLASAGVTGV
jgi:ADP-ribose pyrophosphatase